MRFDANISILFREVPFLGRFARAAAAGIGAVEFWWPRGEDLDEVVRVVRESGLTVALFNVDAGDMAAGDRGLASDPARTAEFRAAVPPALELAARIDCRRLNALLGHRLPVLERADQLALARSNIQWAADQARPSGVEILVEAVNTFENGPYLLSRTDEAADFVRAVGRENVRLQYDVYHMQRMEGNLVATLRAHMDEIGHIQIADAPGRGRPGSGEINYPYVLAAIEELGYGGYIGLEYNPGPQTTEESLAWLPPAARGGEVCLGDLGDLRL